MRILVVGSHGMLGSDLMAALERGHHVLGVDLPDLDIADAGRCRLLAKEFRPAAIINAAALTQVDYCETHEEEAFRVNGEGAGNLASAAASTGSILVHYSTDYVFNGRKREAYEEEDAPDPAGVYGKSKLRGEELVRSLCADHLILRTAWLFGCNGNNFIRTILGAAGEGRPLRVVNDQRGSPSYTKDLAARTALLLDAKARGTYHVTNSGSCTWYELAVGALEWAGIAGVSVTPVTTAEFPRPAPRPANSVLANRRMDLEGFPSMRPWPEAVREYLRSL